MQGTYEARSFLCLKNTAKRIVFEQENKKYLQAKL